MIWTWNHFRPCRRRNLMSALADLSIGETEFLDDQGNHCLMLLLTSFDHGRTSLGWSPHTQQFAVVHLDFNNIRLAQ